LKASAARSSSTITREKEGEGGNSGPKPLHSSRPGRSLIWGEEASQSEGKKGESGWGILFFHLHSERGRMRSHLSSLAESEIGGKAEELSRKNPTKRGTLLHFPHSPCL